MSHAEHEMQARRQPPARVAILTLSDSRTRETDRSGDALAAAMSSHGCEIVQRDLISDDATALRSVLDRWLADESIDAILTTGGTGISPRDQTVDVVASYLRLPLPGFGELFRALSYEQIGAAAMLSRAIAGIASPVSSDGRDKPIFALPGSTAAVTLSANKLIGPQLPHLLAQLRKAETP